MADVLPILEAELTAVLAALASARAAQRYQIGGRSKDAADYASLSRDRDRLIAQISKLGGVSSSAASLVEFESPR